MSSFAARKFFPAAQVWRDVPAVRSGYPYRAREPGDPGPQSRLRLIPAHRLQPPRWEMKSPRSRRPSPPPPTFRSSRRRLVERRRLLQRRVRCGPPGQPGRRRIPGHLHRDRLLAVWGRREGPRRLGPRRQRASHAELRHRSRAPSEKGLAASYVQGVRERGLSVDLKSGVPLTTVPSRPRVVAVAPEAWAAIFGRPLPPPMNCRWPRRLRAAPTRQLPVDMPF